MPSKEERREQYRIKNERRKKKSQTIYAEAGRQVRREIGGAFGKTSPDVFNRLAEGTTATRRAESSQGM